MCFEMTKVKDFEKKTYKSSTVNSEFFARVLFLRK